ncbi:MAG: hypothetical protein KKA68_21360, partial [Gammaproteobacteria bacterium]|nr:hypothetical protein [Gammaproteobacteria bacterium]
KLRLWEDPEKKVTRAQLGRAAAALSPGGFRGQKVVIPGDDLSAVKRKIRAEYRKLDVEDDEIPRWVKESETRNILSYFSPLTEATLTAKGVAKVIIIKPGFGNEADNHYYPVETLRRDYDVFEGVKMYADHQTEDEEKKRPEGSIKEWVASLKNVRYEEGLGIVGDAVIIEPWLQQKLAMLRDKGLLSEMGVSIRAAGIGSKAKVDGKEANVVERITNARSVDFVTEAGAGGGVLFYEADGKEYDIDVVSFETFKLHRPDLVKMVESNIKNTMMQEVKQAMEIENQVKELSTKVEAVTKERDDALGKIAEAEKAKKRAEAKSIIDEAIGKSGLPDAAKAKLTERFKDAEAADGIAEAIKAEQDYIKAITEAGKVKGMGDSKPNAEASHKALVESFKRLGLDDKQAEIAAKGN